MDKHTTQDPIYRKLGGEGGKTQQQGPDFCSRKSLNQLGEMACGGAMSAWFAAFPICKQVTTKFLMVSNVLI